MREIKFRQFCSEEETHNYGMHYDMPYKLIRDGGWINMEYTGFKDKNGVEIWEEDIIQFDDGVRGVVEMQFFSWVIQVKEGKHTLWDMFFDDVSLERIGNTNENKELLK